MPNSDKLDEILEQLTSSWPADSYDINANNEKDAAALAQARAQIVEWALGIVGEDEDEDLDGRYDCPHFGDVHTANALRAELRDKLEGERNG